MPERNDNPSTESLSLTPWLKKFIHAVFYLDGNAPRTLAALLFKPGKLTLSSIHASDDRQFQPLNLYFAVNIIFFLLIPLLSTPQYQVFEFNLQSFCKDNHTFQRMVDHQIAETGIAEDIYTERFNAHLKYNKPAFVFLVIPLLALILKLLYFRANSVWHLITSMHYLSVFLLALLINLALYRSIHWIVGGYSGLISEIIMITLFLAIIVYAYVLLYRVYKNNWWITLFKSIILWLGLFLSLGLYTLFLFFYTYLALQWGY